VSLIFISHSWNDKPIALRMLGRLRDRGYEFLFLDSDPEAGLKAGQEWERELYRNLKLAAAVVVLCSPDSMKSPWCFAEIFQAKALGKAVFPVVVRPCQVIGLLTDRQAIDLAGGDEEGFRRLFDGLEAAGLDPGDRFGWDPRRPPFPGLLYFDEADAGIFFGRDAEVRRVIEMLTRLKLPGEPRLALVVGSSGSGKSSLVRAGVLPRLAKDPQRWLIIPPFRPGTDPVGELARAVASAFPDARERTSWRALRDRLTTEPESASALRDAAEDLTMAMDRREASVLVVVDQTEELLQVSATEEAEVFLTALLRALGGAGRRVVALLTLRSDFLGSFQNHPALQGVPFADLPLGPLTVENFPRVIEGPAARAEILLEPGLVASMVAEVRTDDALPVLAFALREMFERCQEDFRFTLKVYRDELGGIQGAVARAVERVKLQSGWTPDVEPALRQAFLSLTRINEEGRFTRRKARWADLPAPAAPALERFVQARLITSDGDVVEVAHESLFRVWPELAGWLDEGRELMLWRKRIQDEMESWAANHRSDDRLLSGARVIEARRWLTSNAGDFSGPECEFLQASIAAEDARIAEELARQGQLRRLARNLGIATAAALLLVLVASGAGIVAYIQSGQAIAQRDAAEKARKKSDENATTAATNESKAIAALKRSIALRLATQAREALAARLPERAVLLAVRAARVAADGGADELLSGADSAIVNSLRTAVRKTGLLGFRAHGVPVDRLVFSPSGRLLATRGIEGHFRIWNLKKGLLRGGRSPVLQVESGVNAAGFSPDGRTLAIAMGDGTVRLDRIHEDDTIEPGKSYPCHKGAVTDVAFSPDGSLLATASSDRMVMVWRVGPDGIGASPRRSFRGDGPLHRIALSPDGGLVAAASEANVSVWDLNSNALVGDPGRIPPHQEGGRIDSLAFGPRGRFLAVASSGLTNNSGTAHWSLIEGMRVSFDTDGVVRIFDMAQTNRVVYQENFYKMLIQDVAFSPDSRFLAIATRDLTTHLRCLVADNPMQGNPVSIDGHERPVRCVAFSPDGARFATSAEDGTVRIWDLRSVCADTLREPIDLNRRIHLQYPGVNQTIGDLAFSPDGRALASSSSVNARFFDLTLDPTATESRVLDPGRLEVGSQHNVLSFDPKGRWLTAGPFAGNLCIWGLPREVVAAPRVLALGEGLREIEAICCGPGGRLLAVAGSEGVVKIWDVAEDRVAPDLLYTLDLKESPVAVALNGDENLLAVGTEKGLGVWKLARGGPPVRSLSIDESFARHPVARVRGTIGFDPNGRLVVIRKGIAKLYELNLGPPGPSRASVVLESVSDHSALSVGGRYLFCWKWDRPSLLWDLQRERPESRAFSLQPGVWVVTDILALDPYGRWIAASSTSGNDIYLERLTAAVTDLDEDFDRLKLTDATKDVGAMIGLARRRVSRDLMTEEQTHYFPGQAVEKTFPDFP
jgi:WD40 repeat protein